MNGDLTDYLLPVGEPGDKSFSNGKQDIIPTYEQQKKAEEMAKQLLQQKQLELERGNVEHIMEILKKDTPDAAIYRALLLQQLQNTGELKKKEEDKKPGVIKRFALGTAKFLGSMAIRYLIMQTLFHAGDLYRLGPKLTWQKFLAENGVAKTPDLAEATGAATAALGDSIIRRNRNFQDLSENQKKAVLSYAKDKGFMDKINTQSAKFELKRIFNKGDFYFEKLPEGANPADYTQAWGTVLNTGGKGSTIMPMTRAELGDALYDGIFKVGNARTVITPEDGWFLGNEGIRAVDNSFLRIGDLTGHNELKRKAVFDSPEYYGFGPVTKTLAEISGKEMTKKEIDDACKLAVDNVSSLLANTHNPSWLHQTKFNIDPNKLDNLIDKVLNMEGTFISANDVMEAMNPNLTKGINQDRIMSFITKAVHEKFTNMNAKDRQSFYKRLVKDMSNYAFPSFHGDPYLSSSYNPNKKFHASTEKIVKDAVAYTGMAASGLGALASAGSELLTTTVANGGPTLLLEALTNPYTLGLAAAGVGFYLIKKLF